MSETQDSNKGKTNGEEIISSYDLKDEIDTRAEPEIIVNSNIPTLDRLIEGFVPGELIVISGPTKNGKTLFAQTLTVEFEKQAYYPLWFSYEVAPKYFIRAFKDLPLFYVPKMLKQNNLKWVLTRMYEAKKRFGTRVVFIDHLHYLLDLARISNASIQIGTVIRQLKQFAVKFDMVIFLICHTKKVSPEEKLTSEAIRDSSFVAQESDSVLLLHRNFQNPESNLSELIVEFSRRTGAYHTSIEMIKIGYYLREKAFENGYG